MGNLDFIKVKLGTKPVTESKEVFLHISAIVSLRHTGSNQYDVVIKPEYAAAMQRQYYGAAAAIATVTATIDSKLMDSMGKAQ